MDGAIQLDALIVGGGIAGLWTLDTLRRRGYAVWLIESASLGAGQTIQSQGIIHGGLKYALGGSATAASKAIADMPQRWADAIQGPLRDVDIRSRSCLLWSTGGLGRLAMVGAKLGLRARPTPATNVPNCLAGVPRPVLDVPEVVLEPASILGAFAAAHKDVMLRCDGPSGLCLTAGAKGAHADVQAAGNALSIDAHRVVLLAGGGNGPLRAAMGLDDTLMQTRGLRMVLARGDLPVLNGHVIKGSKPWLTITTTTDAHGVRVWQIGGEVAEQGASMTAEATIDMAKSHLSQAMPALSASYLDALDLGTIESPRFEGQTPDGRRPELPTLLVEGSTLTGWPNKLALAPLLADQIADALPPSAHACPMVPNDLPRPSPAEGPWNQSPTPKASPCETAATWNSEHWARAD